MPILKKKRERKDICSINVPCGKAPPKGLEPLTDWLTASRSTGLSYGGTTTTHPLSVQQKYLRIAIYGKPLILSVSLYA
jgi:hypothetical protein